jgi:voltage-gated potassium channel Kch
MRALLALPFVRSLEAIWADTESRVLVVIALGQILVGTVIFRLIEDDWSLMDSLFFCVVTSTTIGYGDLTPSTDASRLVAIVYILTSVGLLGALLTRIASGRAQLRAERLQGRAGRDGEA